MSAWFHLTPFWGRFQGILNPGFCLLVAESTRNQVVGEGPLRRHSLDRHERSLGSLEAVSKVLCNQHQERGSV